MTCIAWSGKVLAADKRCTNNGGLARTCTKIERFEGKLLGMTGDWDCAAELREWYKAGHDPEKFPKTALEDKATLVVINTDGTVWHYTRGPFPMKIEDKIMAWGSGRDFALAAMHCGRTAYEAVEIACIFQTDCGSGIDALHLAMSDSFTPPNASD